MLVEATPRGLFCEAGDFYIDPWRPVDRAVVTHGHADHARPGSAHYLTTHSGGELVRQRVHSGARIETVRFGESRTLGSVRVSLHPAGHILGSAQVRLEHRGHVTVVSGDYKTLPDSTSEAFAPIPCDSFITEATFALPIYAWKPDAHIFARVNEWWRQNQSEGRTSVLFAYALGKAQRILAGVDAGIGPILVHGAVDRFVPLYRDQGIALPRVEPALVETASEHRGRALVLAPPSAQGSPWLRKFQPCSLATASGWMQVRGGRRRRALDRGFVLSDHADWKGLLDTIDATGAETIGVTHGQTDVLSRYLREQGRNAVILETRFTGEVAEDDEADPGNEE